MRNNIIANSGDVGLLVSFRFPMAYSRETCTKQHDSKQERHMIVVEFLIFYIVLCFCAFFIHVLISGLSFEVYGWIIGPEGADVLLLLYETRRSRCLAGYNNFFSVKEELERSGCLYSACFATARIICRIHKGTRCFTTEQNV